MERRGTEQVWWIGKIMGATETFEEGEEHAAHQTVSEFLGLVPPLKSRVPKGVWLSVPETNRPEEMSVSA